MESGSEEGRVGRKGRDWEGEGEGRGGGGGEEEAEWNWMRKIRKREEEGWEETLACMRTLHSVHHSLVEGENSP